MKRFLLSTLSLLFMIFMILSAIYFNFESEFIRTSESTLISSSFIFLWILLTIIGVKKEFTIINVFRLCFWFLSLGSSSLVLANNLYGILPKYIDLLTIPNMLFNQTILKGLSFSNSTTTNNVIFIVIALIFLISPTIYRLILKFNKVKVNKEVTAV